MPASACAPPPRVFARDGLNGATTRAIAREAAVNEVTLFRLFRSKERLLAAVVGETFGDRNPLAQAGAAGLHWQPAGRPDPLRPPLRAGAGEKLSARAHFHR